VSFPGSVTMSPTAMQVARHDVVESGPMAFAVSSGPCQVLDGMIPREATSNSDTSCLQWRTTRQHVFSNIVACAIITAGRAAQHHVSTSLFESTHTWKCMLYQSSVMYGGAIGARKLKVQREITWLPHRILVMRATDPYGVGNMSM
jgi:hypothetical protein